MSTEPMAGRRQACLRRIEAALDGVFDDIERIAAELERLWEGQAGLGKAPVSADLKSLRTLADDRLTRDNRWVLGTGVVLEPGVLADCDMFCEWRHLVGEGKPAQLDLNFNRSSDSYYNYRDMPWFTQPRETGRRVVEGPYIDLYGQDAYILTFARPLQCRGDFLGIAGADVHLGRFERILVPGLLQLEHDALLVNASGRVIASNTPGWLPGERFRMPDQGSPPGCLVTPLAGQHAHWQLVESLDSALVRDDG
ncbi:cache domain-containing protein [Halomonas pacifica]|uniref:cache domain-containing protein n=1 Tax=Bisbaumannia pacifica TaxID=77098 RepID=UPI00235A09BD|nr:cache domain-containing protein [Halomonas pacifica]MDC8804076.1 cache domain-containing protein [Halomonas pacifica]